MHDLSCQLKRQRNSICEVKAMFPAKPDKVKARELYNQGIKDLEISKILGVSYKCISEWRRRNKLPNLYKIHRFNENEALKLWQDGLIDREIAKQMNCSVQVIKRWRDLNDLPANNSLFNWQDKVEPREFARIPDKYRKRANAC